MSAVTDRLKVSTKNSNLEISNYNFISENVQPVKENKTLSIEDMENLANRYRPSLFKFLHKQFKKNQSITTFIQNYGMCTKLRYWLFTHFKGAFIFKYIIWGMGLNPC